MWQYETHVFKLKAQNMGTIWLIATFTYHMKIRENKKMIVSINPELQRE